MPECIARRISTHRAIALERVQRRHPEELEIVEGLEVGPVDHGRSFGLDPECDSGAGKLSAVVGDEGDVRHPPNPHDTRLRTRLNEALDDLL